MSAPSIPEPRPLPPAPALRWGLMAPGGIASRFVDRSRASTPAIRRGRVTLHGTSRALRDGAWDRARVWVIRGGGGRDTRGRRLYSVPAQRAQGPRIACRHGGQARAHREADGGVGHRGAGDRRCRRAAGVMAMEGMWTRYLPQADVIRQLLAAGRWATCASRRLISASPPPSTRRTACSTWLRRVVPSSMPACTRSPSYRPSSAPRSRSRRSEVLQ